MAKLSRDDVLKLAKLAQLSFSDEELDGFVNELSSILDYVEQLQAVDTSGVKPTDQVTGLLNVMRKDVVKDYGYTPANLMAIVPVSEEGQIKVKRIL